MTALVVFISIKLIKILIKNNLYKCIVFYRMIFLEGILIVPRVLYIIIIIKVLYNYQGTVQIYLQIN